MSYIAIHDSEAEHFKHKAKFPNYALMKISAYHKALGDEVVWFYPMEAHLYDKVYSSKVFDWTPENQYLPDHTIKGGTGYGIYDDLPPEIDACFPDYSIYPECDYAIGFLTRGCIRKCRWCVVPKKEGYIHPYRTWQDIVRPDTKKLTLMDNNILACEYGIAQLEELSHTDYRLDLNQGMDARLVTPEIADILARCKWQRYLRFSCDQKSQIEPIWRVAELLQERGLPPSKLFVYCLITKDEQDCVDRIDAMRRFSGIRLYGMPEKNPALGIMPEPWQNHMANKYLYSGQWRKMNWSEWKETHQHFLKKETTT